MKDERIQFDTKYRTDIESGRYKVETRDGRPARVVCWDANKELSTMRRPVLVNINESYTISVFENGRLWGDAECNQDLFLVQVSDFEKCFERLVEEARETPDWRKNIKADCELLMMQAIKEIVRERDEKFLKMEKGGIKKMKKYHPVRKQRNPSPALKRILDSITEEDMQKVKEEMENEIKQNSDLTIF